MTNYFQSAERSSLLTPELGNLAEASRRSVAALSIRGISDYADASKSMLEAETKGGVRKIAALNAASFLQMQLRNPYFFNLMDRRRQIARKPSIAGHCAEPSEPWDLTLVIRDLGQIIDEKLGELSPEYRLREKGYRLPLPRVRQVFLVSASSGRRSPPVEIRDALSTHHSYS